MRTVNVITFLICSLMICTKVQAASITYSQTIDVDGSIKLLFPGNALCFSDGTCQTSAITTDGSAIWGQITGLISQQEDLQTALDYKADLLNGKLTPTQVPQMTWKTVNRVPVDGYTPTWQVNPTTWTEMPEFTTVAPVAITGSKKMRIIYTDNIGINGSLWCNVGIFLEGMSIPVCSGSWSGSPYHAVFGQQTITCDPEIMSTGLHTVKVKHRSGNCAYGNYAFDQYGATRQLTIEVYE